MASMRVLVAGGHTGGHIQCALAIARALEARAPGLTVCFGGADGGPEIRTVRDAGYSIETAWIGPLDRRGGTRALAGHLRLAAQLLVSNVQAGRLIDGFAPEVAV